MRYLVSLFALSFLLAGCKKKLTEFYIDYTSELVIQSSIGQALPFSVYTPQVVTNSEFKFESNNTNKKKIDRIILSDMVLTITSPSGETFSFLNSIELFISSPDHTEKKVAFKENISSSIGAVITCDLLDLELQEFIMDDSFTIRMKVVTDETLPNDVYIDAYTRFFVKAKLLN
ncbi:MAG: hypothetical protein ACI865_001806 [Flavobacteriaceae bacterium]|jgi:hypothetical protein